MYENITNFPFIIGSIQNSILFNSKSKIKIKKNKKKVNKIIIEKNIKLNRTIGITALHEQCNLSVYTGRRDNLR